MNQPVPGSAVPLVDSVQMAEIDRLAQEQYGIPGIVLMESAGASAWNVLAGRIGATDARAQRVVFLAGAGNNGGDALVMARYCRLFSNHEPSVIIAGASTARSRSSSVEQAIVERLGIDEALWPDQERRSRKLLAAADWIVDGLAGTGIRGALREPLDQLCAAVNRTDAKVAAVDCPSGLGDSWRHGMPAVRADLTLSMGLPKRCLYRPQARPLCGEIAVVPVTFPVQLLSPQTGTLLAAYCPRTTPLRPAPESFKHRRGTVGVYAGQVGTTGAALLAAEGAARCGAGLVTLCADHAIYPILAGSAGSVMVRPLDGAPAGFDAVVVGPGWGTGEERFGLLSKIVRSSKRGVLDADAITLLSAANGGIELGSDWVLTPHPGELARLLGTTAADVLADYDLAAGQASIRTKAVVVAKAHVTVIAEPGGKLAVVDGMNPAMGTGGTGDVLAGAIGGLLAGGCDGWTAAVRGVLIHQEAGRRLRDRSGFFLAEELPAEIGRAAYGA